MKIYIYGLRNEDSTEYRYIGKTKNIKSRLNSHIKEPKRKFAYHKYNWIQKSLRENKKIILDIIEEVNETNWEDKEKFYIKEFKKMGHKLTNLLEGGQSPQMYLYKLSYEESKSIAQGLNINTTLKWRKMAKNNQLPKEIPKRPDLFYNNNGWVSWADFLGKEIVKNKDKIFYSFEECLIIVHKLKLKSNKEWRIYCKNRDKKIPSLPDLYYKEWINWKHWLGY